jgi:hypothetical protein
VEHPKASVSPPCDGLVDADEARPAAGWPDSTPDCENPLSVVAGDVVRDPRVHQREPGHGPRADRRDEGKGWFPILRLYSPGQSFFDKTWQPSEIETVKTSSRSTS